MAPPEAKQCPACGGPVERLYQFYHRRWISYCPSCKCCYQKHELEQMQEKKDTLMENLRRIEEQERALHSKTSELKKREAELEENSLQFEKKKDMLAQSMAELEQKEQMMQQKKAEQEENMRQIEQKKEVLQKKAVELQKNEEEFQRNRRSMQEKKNKLMESLLEIEEKERVLHCKTSELLKKEEELEQKSHEVQKMREELEKNIRELQEIRSKKLELLEKELLERNALGKRLVDETDQDSVRGELRDLKAVVHGLQQEMVRMAAHMDASSGHSDASSVHTLDSWIHMGSPKPCCFHPDAHFKVFTSDGPAVLAPASMLHQGARVQSASGKVVEVAQPPEQHQVESVIELKAGTASLVVSPDHRVLVPGNKTVKAEELSQGDEVILDGIPARLSSWQLKTGKMLVIRLGFKPDLPVAVSARFASAVSFSLKIGYSIVCTHLNLHGDPPVLNLLLHP